MALKNNSLNYQCQQIQNKSRQLSQKELKNDIYAILDKILGQKRNIEKFDKRWWNQA